MYSDEKRRTLLPHRKPCNSQSGNQLKQNKPFVKKPVAAKKAVSPVAEKKAASVVQAPAAFARLNDSVVSTDIVRASDWWPLRGGLSSEDGPDAWWNTAMRLTGTRKCHVMSIQWYMAYHVRELRQANKHSFGGCYILRNMQTGIVYVGQSVDVPSRVYQHFSDSGCHGVYDDFCNKQADFEICMIDKDDTKYEYDDDLNRFERELIAAYDAYRSGYNLTRGNCLEEDDWLYVYA